MHRSILCLALFSGSVSAETSFDKYKGSIGSAVLNADTVEVTLFHGPSGSSVPMVAVSVGDREYLMALNSSVSGVYLSKRVGEEQDLKVFEGNKKLINIHGKSGKWNKGGEAKTAKISTMSIGGLVLNDVTASLQPLSSLFDNAGDRPWNTLVAHSKNLDGVIGLEALPSEISWAILPSVGTVAFANSGTDLVPDGFAFSYTDNPSEFATFATQQGSRDTYLQREIVVDGVSVAGVDMPTRLEVGMEASAVLWTEELPADVTFKPGVIRSSLVTIEPFAESIGASVVAEYTAIEGVERTNGLYVGSDVLRGYDIAMDRGAKTIRLKAVDSVKRTNPLAMLIGEAEKALASNEAEPVGDGSDAETAAGEEAGKPSVPGTAKDWTTLMNLHRAKGSYDDALTAALNAVSFDERDCVGWSNVGRAHLEVGDLESAVAAFKSSSMLYHSWFDLPLEQRLELKEELSSLSATEKAEHPHAIASGTCHTADGFRAWIALAQGDVVTVENLYREHLDLDATLALIAGNALVLKGEYAHAQEPLRQAMMKQRGYRSTIRLALAALYSGQGDWESATALFDRVLATNQDLQTVIFYLDTIGASEGQDSAIEAAKALAAAYPNSAGAVFGLGYAASKGADTMLSESSRISGTDWFESAFRKAPHSAATAGARARWMTLWDPSSVGTKKAVRAAMSKNSNNKDALIASAAVAEASGDSVKAEELTQRAAKLGADHIGYASMLTSNQ